MVLADYSRHIANIFIKNIARTSILEAEPKGSGFFNAFMPGVIQLSKKISRYFRNLKVYEDKLEEN